MLTTCLYKLSPMPFLSSLCSLSLDFPHFQFLGLSSLTVESIDPEGRSFQDPTESKPSTASVQSVFENVVKVLLIPSSPVLLVYQWEPQTLAESIGTEGVCLRGHKRRRKRNEGNVGTQAVRPLPPTNCTLPKYEGQERGTETEPEEDWKKVRKVKQEEMPKG